MISDVLMVVTQVGMLMFIVAGMAAMGLSLTTSRIRGRRRHLTRPAPLRRCGIET